jgi:hypothetical protein
VFVAPGAAESGVFVAALSWLAGSGWPHAASAPINNPPRKNLVNMCFIVVSLIQQKKYMELGV